MNSFSQISSIAVNAASQGELVLPASAVSCLINSSYILGPIGGAVGGLVVTGLFVAGVPLGIGAAIGVVAALVSTIGNSILDCIIPTYLQQNPAVLAGKFIVSISLATMVGATAVAAGVPIALPAALIIAGTAAFVGAIAIGMITCCCVTCCMAGMAIAGDGLV